MAPEQQDNIQPWRDASIDGYMPGTVMQPDQVPQSRNEYAGIFIRRRKLMISTLLIIFTAGMLYTFTRRPIYESTAKIVVASNTGGGATSADDITLLSDLRALTRSRSVDTQVEMISSPDLLKEAYDSLSNSMRAVGFGSEPKMPEWATKIAARKNTDVILVMGRAYTPSASSTLANNLANVYLKRDMERNNQATRQAREYAGEQMIVAQKELSIASADLAEFKRRTGFYAPEAQLNKTAEQMAQLSSELVAAKAEEAADARQTGAMAHQLSREQPNVVANTTINRNPEFDAVRQRISDLNSQRVALMQEFTPESREIKTIDDRIRQEENHLKQIAQSVVGSSVKARNPVRDNMIANYANSAASYSASSGRVKALTAALARHEQAARLLPQRERGYSVRAQRVAQLQRTYEALADKYNALLLTEQSTLPSGLLASRAHVPESPAYPKTMSNAVLFLLLGVLCAVAAAIVADRIDTRVNDEAEMEHITHLPSLSIVPNLLTDSPLLSSGNSSLKPAMLESFRILRNSIQFYGLQEHPKTIAITSPGRGEGKSTTSVNLAIAMSMEGKRVLLVDADLRRPSLARMLNLPSKKGLSTILAGKSSLTDCVMKTKMENVWCLPSGPTLPNAAELLNTLKSRELFKQLADQYDVVLVDSPPSAGLCDIQVISGLTDGVLLVVSMNQTHKPHLYMTLRTLSQAGARVIGMVVNRVNTRHCGYGDYDYCELPSEKFSREDEDDLKPKSNVKA